MALIETRSLTAFYGDFQALYGIDLRLEEGETLAIIGANGAGKSTFLKTVAGLLPAAPESVLLDGRQIGGLPAPEIVRLGISLVPEGRRLFTRMSVEENLELGAYRAEARRERHGALERVFGLFPVLRERRRQLAGSLSGGQQQMVAIGRALMARPRLLLLDEPSLGLAPALVDQMFDIIRAIHGEGVAILLVEQNVAKALEIASRVYVLEEGRTVASGTPAELLAESSIQDAYLGR